MGSVCKYSNISEKPERENEDVSQHVPLPQHVLSIYGCPLPVLGVFKQNGSRCCHEDCDDSGAAVRRQLFAERDRCHPDKFWGTCKEHASVAAPGRKETHRGNCYYAWPSSKALMMTLKPVKGATTEAGAKA